jgi:hypothetical protein
VLLRAEAHDYFPAMRPLWIKAALALVAVWLVAGGAIFLARSAKVTPASFTQHLETLRLEGKAASAREKEIDKVADQLNRLTYEERREVRMSRKIDGFFRTLTPDEQVRFLDRTLPTGFKQMMDALNKMERPKRQQFVSRTLKEIRERDGEERERAPEEEAAARKIIDQGFKSFYSEASAETKLDVAPLIEEMQKNLQGFH